MGLPLHHELANLDLQNLDRTISYDKMLDTYYNEKAQDKSYKEVQIGEAVQLLTEFNRILAKVDK